MMEEFLNKQALLSYLSRDEFAVSEARSHRTNAQREHWILKNALEKTKAAFADGPVRLEARESPDFLIHTGDVCYGVEVTEIVPNAVAQGLSHIENHDSINAFSLDQLWHLDRSLTSSDNIIELAAIEGSSGFAGSEPERLVAGKVQESVARKSHKLEQGLYERFEVNAYIGYISNPPAPIHLTDLRRILRCSPNLCGSFDCVLVMADGWLMRFKE